MRKTAYYCVVDVEATCSADNSIPRNEMEIIEIGAVMVDAITLDAVDEFQRFVQPQRHPQLTQFCIELTSIRQIEVDFAWGFPRVIDDLKQWLRAFPDNLFCSWGDYDRIQFERDCRYHNVAYPFGRSHLNLKKAYATRQRLKRPIGMARAVRQAGLRLSGIHHRGIDDARNIAKLLPYIV